MQGALPPAPPASPRNSRGATPCQAINFDIFRHIERECSQGFKGGDFRRKYYPSLDGTERHTALAEGKATRLSLLPHGECGVWGNAPRVKFRDGVRPPFSKGEEDWKALFFCVSIGGGTTTPPYGCFVLCDAFWGCRGEAPAPRRAPCFDTQCQNSYRVTLDKSNRTVYT